MVSSEPFPALDYTLSSFTGWTRAHWEAIFARLTYGYVLAAGRSGSPARALYPDDRRNLPDATDALESFARMASAWGAWLGNPNNPACVAYQDHQIDIEMLLRDALLEGTNPDNPSTYWGNIDHMSQHIVETADIAATLWISRERVFFKMTEAEQRQIMEWLAQVDGKGTYPDNWVLFAAMNQAVRHRLGFLSDTTELDFRLAQTQAFYHGDGWYVDGEASEFELYNAWMFGWHYLLWAWIDGDRLPEHRQRVLERAKSFINGFQHFFGVNGSYTAWGRSIVYRFSAVSVFATGYLMGIAPDNPGLLRRITSGCLRYFYDHEMFDPSDHYLRQGYHGDFPAAGESYISPGSPYWACHGLFALYFDRDDPFWTAAEAPLPVEQGDFDIALPKPGFAISGRQATGQVLLLNSRAGIEYDSPRYNYSAKYSKLVYSTHFPFNVLSAGGSFAPDAMIALIDPNGQWGHRQMTRHSGIAPAMMWCDFNEMAKGEPQKVRVAVCLWGDVQIRMAYILPTLPVRAAEAPGALGCERAADVVRLSDAAAGWEYAEAEGRAVGIQRLYGYDSQQVSAPFQGYSNINLAYPYAEMPLVSESAFSATARGLASASLLRPASFDPAAELKDISVTCDSSGVFRASLPDGEMIAAPLGFERTDTLVVDGLGIKGVDLRCVRVKPDAAEICGMSIIEVISVVQLSEPATIRLKRPSNGEAYISTSTGLTLAEGWLGGSPRRVEAKTVTGAWEDVSRWCSGGEIPASLVMEWARRNERTLIDFRVQL